MSSIQVRKKMEVSGAAVPSVEKIMVGLLMSALAWLSTEPAMNDPRNTVMNCKQSPCYVLVRPDIPSQVPTSRSMLIAAAEPSQKHSRSDNAQTFDQPRSDRKVRASLHHVEDASWLYEDACRTWKM